MRAFTRACVVAGLVLAATGAAPAAFASPAPSPSAGADDCTRGTDEYGAPLPCEVDVASLTAVCDANVPRLQYALAPVGTDHRTVTITFVNPTGGPDVVYADQPLSGTVTWPGAVTDASGAGVDWPGWRLEGGTWVQGDEFDWAAGSSVEVDFHVNPTASVVTAYPRSTASCLTSPERSDVLSAGSDVVAGGVAASGPRVRAEVLSATGATTGPVVLVGAGLVLAGAAGVLVARRRRA
jgi:LPXTG-motif cell wall-anchored protein